MLRVRNYCSIEHRFSDEDHFFGICTFENFYFTSGFCDYLMLHIALVDEIHVFTLSLAVIDYLWLSSVFILRFSLSDKNRCYIGI